MPRILLHICCGICSSAAIQKLKEDGFEVCGIFYNPNIHPEDEYLRRLEVARKVADILEIKLLETGYEKESWLAQIKGLEKEPEGGRRCAVCFKLRLAYTARVAKEQGLDYFTTTLSISPHKDTKLINEIGKAAAPSFLEYDFKKENGFKKAADFAKTNQLYRQNYCGCIFSKKVFN
jgi:predicted adenine nucleotide alpha hydrolase (AANH) superfamily ATPase